MRGSGFSSLSSTAPCACRTPEQKLAARRCVLANEPGVRRPHVHVHHTAFGSAAARFFGEEPPRFGPFRISWLEHESNPTPGCFQIGVSLQPQALKGLQLPLHFPERSLKRDPDPATIKTVRVTDESDDACKRLWREARSFACVSHPRVCQLFDADDDGETLFLVLELLESYALPDTRRLRGSVGFRRLRIEFSRKKVTEPDRWHEVVYPTMDCRDRCAPKQLVRGRRHICPEIHPKLHMCAHPILQTTTHAD